LPCPSISRAALGSKLTTDSAKAEVSRLRAAAGEIMSLSNTYATPPPPIDFAAYKSKISAADVVDKFQAEYARINYPTYVVEEVAEIKAKHDALIAEAMGSVSDSKARIEVLNSLISSMEANKVGHYNAVSNWHRKQ